MFVELKNTEREIEMFKWNIRKSSFVVPTFEKFFTTEELKSISEMAGTRVAWDFNSALGDTIKERYEALYVKMVELTNILVAKGAAGYFWICASPEIISIFETVAYGFSPTKQYDSENTFDLGVNPIGIGGTVYIGSINRKWRLYKNAEMPVDMAIVGCNDELEDSSHYGVMEIINFV